MRNGITAAHFTDADGKPSGGTTYGIGFAIGWQAGPLGRGVDRKIPNGAFVEDIIDAAINRIDWYQRNGFPCDENAHAILNLRAALHALESRTARREREGTEGTHKGQ